MYLEHYGLTEAPFRVTPDPNFFFTGAKRGATLDALLYAVTHDEGIVKASGEVGSGKTMVCRMLIQRLPPQVLPIYLGNPAASREDILHSIADELHVSAATTRPSAILRVLQERLIRLRGEGRQVLLLIDEAHALSVETLEEIRLLSNLESEHHNLLQLVLFGQPELNRILARPDMRQLKERITHHFSLEPLALSDIAAYLNFRLRAAGYRGAEIFSAAAVKLIAKVSLGLTRRINVLADKSLLAACAENTHQVLRRHVNSAIRDSEFAARRSAPAWLAATALRSALAGSALLLALFAFWPEREAPPAPALANPAPLEAAPGPATAATTGAAAAAPPAAAASEGEHRLRAGKFGPQTGERIAATERWLAGAADDHWFIQLLATEARSAEKIEGFVAETVAMVGTEQLRVYVAEVQGNQRVGVIYGDYPSREAALAAVAQLPEPLRNSKPFPRKVKSLR